MTADFRKCMDTVATEIVESTKMDGNEMRISSKVITSRGPRQYQSKKPIHTIRIAADIVTHSRAEQIASTMRRNKTANQ